MKHIWCIDDDKFTLKEGYVLDDYKDYEDDFVYSNETHGLLGTYKVKNITQLYIRDCLYGLITS